MERNVPDAEYLASDFDVLNDYTLHASPFTHIVVVQSFFFSRICEAPRGPCRWSTIASGEACVAKSRGALQGESERVEALEKHFGINYTSKRCMR